jgi:hypothetical protein
MYLVGLHAKVKIMLVGLLCSYIYQVHPTNSTPVHQLVHNLQLSLADPLNPNRNLAILQDLQRLRA